MLKRHEIQVLRRAGHSQSEVAQLAGVSIQSVRRIDREQTVAHADDALERQTRSIGRPCKTDPFLPLIKEILAEKPDILSIEIFSRLQKAGYTGGKTVVFDAIRSLRPKPQKPLVRFEGLPGEFSQHDFGQVEVTYADGTRERIHFFATRMKYSRYALVSLVDDEKVESLVRTLVDHFDRIGGIPLLAVFDRPRTVALAWKQNGEVTEWNPTFSAVVMDLSLGVEVCWPYSPQQKGSVENLVGWVKNSFFRQKRFTDRQDLERELSCWLEETNHRRPCRATGTIPATRLEEERARLRPLKVKPSQLSLRFPVVVGPTATVRHQGACYSMPADAIGVGGTLYLFEDRVRIVAGRHEAAHPRLSSGEKSLLAEHGATVVSAVSGKRAKRYAKREQIIGLGESALSYVTELVHRRHRTWASDIDRLHELFVCHGPEPLCEAFAWAHQAETFGAEYIAHYLEQRDFLAAGGTSR